MRMPSLPGLMATLLLAACHSSPPERRITLWIHSGPGPERQVYEASIRAFNAGHRAFQVDLALLPEGSYDEQIHAAALAGKLPAVLEFDGPYLYSYVWARKVVPLDDLPGIRALRRDLLPTLVRQGTYKGHLYALGQYDSGLALWGNRRLLARAGARLPAGVDQAWDLAEFQGLLGRLKAQGVPWPLDLKLNYGAGEWFTYAFAPIIASFGGALLDLDGPPAARGAINGPAAVRALTLVQDWARAGYVHAAARDDADFVRGRSALSYVGHWAYQAYRRALGADLVLLPMPRFGDRAVTCAGSWSFGVSSDCRDLPAAAELLAYLMAPAQIAAVTAANGAIPGTLTALRASPAYQPGGPLAIYADQVARGLAMVRPQSPAYPVVSSAFAEAVNNILAGADVRTELDRAAAEIDREIADNHGYPDP